MRGIILAGGTGTRLHPATMVMNKHLVPILNCLMILYPLATLKTLGVSDILIVSGGNHIGGFADFLGDGSNYGVSLTYRVQKKAGGIAEAIGLGENFADKQGVIVILGDNIFDNSKLKNVLKSKDTGIEETFLVFAKVEDPSRFGVPVFKNNKLKTIEEKPKSPQSDFAVTGLYIYPPNVFDVIKKLKPSARGELEVSDLNNWYISRKLCSYNLFDGFWSDAGTVESLAKTTAWAASNLSTVN